MLQKDKLLRLQQILQKQAEGMKVQKKSAVDEKDPVFRSSPASLLKTDDLALLKTLPSYLKTMQKIPGSKGERGERGRDGKDGRDGNGIKGERGEKGEKGDPGKDAEVDMAEVQTAAGKPTKEHEKKHDHSLLHDPSVLGTTSVDESGRKDQTILRYDEKKKKLVYDKINVPTATPYARGGGASSLHQLNDTTVPKPDETAPADNELLSFDSTTGKWINQTASEAGLATVADLSGYVPYTGATGSVALGANSLTATGLISSTFVRVGNDASNNTPGNIKYSAGAFWGYVGLAPNSGEWLCLSNIPVGNNYEMQYKNGGEFGGASFLTIDPDNGNINIAGDNVKLLFGAGQDASIYYDATSLVINPKEVGTGNVNVLGNVYVSGLTGSKLVFTDSNKVLTSTGPGTSSQYIKGDGSLGDALVTSVATDVGLTGGTITSTGTISQAINGFSQGRLTLTTATPVTTADVTAATTVYFTPYNGDLVTLYDASVWKTIRFTEKSIGVTNTQNANTTNGNAVLTGLTDTTQLLTGMLVTGTGIGAAPVTIVSIDSATQVTLDVNCTATGAAPISFKLPTGKNYDIFYVQSSGTLQWSNAWTSDTARNDALVYQNGVSVNNAAINGTDFNTIPAKKGLYLGTIRTTANGQTEDSNANRFVWNNFNRVARSLQVLEATNSWTYTTATWRQANGSTANQLSFIAGEAGHGASASVWVYSVSNTGGIARSVAIGANRTNLPSGTMGHHNTGADIAGIHTAFYSGLMGLGLNYLAWLEFSTAAGTSTWYGDAGVAYLQSGITGTWMC